MFRDAARKRHRVDPAAISERIEPQQPGRAEIRRAALHRLEQAIGHAGGEPPGVLRREACADISYIQGSQSEHFLA